MKNKLRMKPEISHIIIITDSLESLGENPCGVVPFTGGNKNINTRNQKMLDRPFGAIESTHSP